jgi:hypothetical protein
LDRLTILNTEYLTHFNAFAARSRESSDNGSGGRTDPAVVA